MGKNINRVRPHGFVMGHGIWRQGLSLKAIGLLCVLLDLSQLPDWEFSLAGLVALSEQNGMGDGRDSIRSAIAELEAKGLLLRERERGEGGTLAGTRWLVSDQPMAEPGSGEPTSEKPTLVDRPQEGSSSIEEERKTEPPLSPLLPGFPEPPSPPTTSAPKKRRKPRAKPPGPVEAFAPYGKEAAAVLLDWWQNHKSGAKTNQALQLQIAELKKIMAMGGSELVKSQAELAIHSGVMRGKGWSQINASRCREYGSAGRPKGFQGAPAPSLPSQELLDIYQLARRHPDLFTSAEVVNGRVEVAYSALVRARFGYPDRGRFVMESALRAEINGLKHQMGSESPLAPF
jgi:hypothetical protein